MYSTRTWGTNPFGAWHQASNAYWAYVLVQYDDDTSSYRYGYTFKDSAGYSSTIFTLNLGENFDTSNVRNMHNMFFNTGKASTKFTLNLGGKFNTSNVTDMDNMFNTTGYNSSLFKLDCSSWNVDNVTSHINFNVESESKVTPPKWVN